MTEPSSSPPEGGPALPREFPPVEPPSAGMIVQLFLIPAGIVAVIVGVYALFGQIVTRDLDWKQLVRDVQSGNEHIRWRRALDLAQALDADARRGAEGQRLAANPEIAAVLSGMYIELAAIPQPNEEELKQLEFLSKALGRLEVSESVVPAFRTAMAPGHPRDVRKHALIGLAMHAGVLSAQQRKLEAPGLDQEIVAISREPEPLFRHQAAFLLGLLPSSDVTQERLTALLDDPDEMTRMNAAIGFARQGDKRSLPVFLGLLREAEDWRLDPAQVRSTEDESRYFERMLMLMNALKAVQQLQSKLTTDEREQLRQQLSRLSDSTADVVLRTTTIETLEQLTTTKAT